MAGLVSGGGGGYHDIYINMGDADEPEGLKGRVKQTPSDFARMVQGVADAIFGAVEKPDRALFEEKLDAWVSRVSVDEKSDAAALKRQLTKSYMESGKIEPLMISHYDSLESLPDVFGHFTRRMLVISRNASLQELPPSIGQVHGCMTLKIERNPQLDRLPEAIGKFKGDLVEIYDNPKLTSVPRSLSELPAKATVRIEMNYAIPSQEIDALKRKGGPTIIRTSPGDMV